MFYTIKRSILALLNFSLLTLTISQSLTEVPLTIWTDRASTFAIQDAATIYALVDPNVRIEIVSGDNQQNPLAVMNGTADIAMISSSLSYTYALSRPSLYTLPLFAAAVVPVYRLDAIGKSIPLTLSREALARIYMGEITWWNDTAIQSTNPTLTMPAKRITITIDAERNEVHRIYTQGFTKFAANFSNVFPITDDPIAYWPLDKYGAYNWFQGLFGVSTGVYNTDGAIGMVYQSIAIVTQNQIASMINKANMVVRPTKTSVAFAATELGTALSLISTDAADVSDCSAAAGWPLTMFSYILVDIENARGTCRSRAALVKFFLDFYQSPTTDSLLGIREIARVPDIVMKQLEIIQVLGSLIKCRGNAAISNRMVDTRTMAVPRSLQFLSNLLISTYPSTQRQWVLDVNPDDVNVQRLVQNEVDLVFFDPEAVDPAKLAALRADDSFWVLPVFGFSFTWTYNPQIAYGIHLSKPLVLTEHLVSLIYYSCLLDWNDPRIVELNPWIVDDLQGQTIPIKQILACYSTNLAPAATYLIKVGDHLLENLNSTDPFAQCVADYALWDHYYDCTDIPEYNIQYVLDETVTQVLVVGTWGSQGVMVAVNDPVYTMPQLKVTGKDGSSQIVNPDPAGMFACASDTFDPATLSFDFRQSKNISCFPWTQQVWVAFRKNYVSDATDAKSCDRGVDALNYLSWLLTTGVINTVTESENFIRLSQDPVVLAAYIKTLNNVKCDGETMLIKLPIEWSLSPGFAVFGWVAAALGIVMTIALGGAVVYYHRHPIIRASSPLFMLLSLLGVVLLFAGAATLTMPVSTESCDALSWLINLGLAITFAPLFAKVWRIYRIFGRRKLSVVKISNKYLFGIIGILLAFEAILLIVWRLLSPIQPYTAIVWEGTPQREHHYTQCGVEDEGRTMFAIIGVEKGLLFAFGSLMAFTTRRVTSSFNESSQVSLSIYNVLFSIGIIAPVILVIDAKGDILIALLLFVLLWISFFTALILVVPKLLHIWGGDQNAGENASVGASSSSGFSFLSLAALVTPVMGKTYLMSLKRHVEAVEAHVAAQQKGQRHKMEEDVLDRKEPRTVSALQPRAPSASSHGWTQSSSGR